MPDCIDLRSYAKINRALRVLYRRPDGYHELRTIFQTVSLHDSIRLTRQAGGIEISCNDPRVPLDETNLVHRAAMLLGQACGRSGTKAGGVHISITKRIPVGAGLGGGSSNAAAALLGLVRLWKASIEFRELVGMAASLGADVPFFLLGGTALGIGRGDEVYPLEDHELHNIVLVNPGFTVSTAEIYGRLPWLTSRETLRIIPFNLFAAKGIRELPLAPANDLEEVALPAYPEIATVKSRLLDLGAREALMTGSGATVFGVFENHTAGEKAGLEMREAGYWSECAGAITRKEYRDTIFETGE